MRNPHPCPQVKPITTYTTIIINKLLLMLSENVIDQKGFQRFKMKNKIFSSILIKLKVCQWNILQ